MITLDGYNEAILGVANVWQNGERIETLVYSAESICTILMDRDGMTEEEAIEFIGFNIEGLYAGTDTPILVWPKDYEDTAYT